MASAMALLPLLILSISLGLNEEAAAKQPPLQSTARDFLQSHNQARAAVGVGPLKWSQTLANASSRLVRRQRDKMGCQFADLSTARYGGNQLWASGMAVTPLMAVDHWVRQKIYYNHTSNSCLPNHDQCGVFTQVVWKKSLELGCAQASCVKEQASLTVCFYYPPGNIIGESPY